MQPARRLPETLSECVFTGWSDAVAVRCATADSAPVEEGDPLAIYMGQMCTSREDERWIGADPTGRRGVDASFTFSAAWSELSAASAGSSAGRRRRAGQAEAEAVGEMMGDEDSVVEVGSEGEEEDDGDDGPGGLALVGSTNGCMGGVINATKDW